MAEDTKAISEDIIKKLAADTAAKKVATPSPKPLIEEDWKGELSEQDKAELAAQAKADLAKEDKAAKKKAFLEAEKLRLKKEALLKEAKNEEGEELESIFITLPSHMPFVRLDSKVYYPSRQYTVSKSVAAVLKEQMFRGDQHQAELQNQSMNNFYRSRSTAPLPQGIAYSN